MAVWSKAINSFLVIDTLKIHYAMEFIREYKSAGFNILVRIEDARKRRWIPQERDIQQRIGRAKGAGSVSRDAKIWEDFLTDLDIDFELVAPAKGMTKYNAAAFKKLTKYEGVTSEHGRDAGLLVFGY